MSTHTPAAVRRTGHHRKVTLAERIRVERGASHLHSLNAPRVTAEFLIELAARTDGEDVLLALLNTYTRLTPAMARAVGADRDLVHVRQVPPELMRGTP